MIKKTYEETFKEFDPIAPCPSTVAPPLVHSDSFDSVTTQGPSTPKVEDTVLFSNPFTDTDPDPYTDVFVSDDEEEEEEESTFEEKK